MDTERYAVPHGRMAEMMTGKAKETNMKLMGWKKTTFAGLPVNRRPVQQRGR
jgi:hypothetical protein